MKKCDKKNRRTAMHKNAGKKKEKKRRGDNKEQRQHVNYRSREDDETDRNGKAATVLAPLPILCLGPTLRTISSPRQLSSLMRYMSWPSYSSKRRGVPEESM